MSSDRRELLDRYGRFYGSEHFAVTFTASTNGDDAKRVTTKGWDKVRPLPGSDFGAGLLVEHGKTRNVAVVLRPSNLIVIECDSEPDLVAIEALGLPQTLTVRSSEPFKRHFYFRPPEQLGTLPYVAFRFESGKVTADSGRYFLAPPSLHPSGVQYGFLPGLGPDETDIAELPEHVYRQLVERSRRDSDEQRERLAVDPQAKVLPGRRRESVFRYACQQRRWTADEAEIVEAAFRWNLAHCEPPLSREQVAGQVKGAMKMPGEQELRAATAPDDEIIFDTLKEQIADLRPASDAPRTDEHITVVEFVPVEQFVAHPIEQAEPIVVDATGSTAIAANGLGMSYGDGGAGKTTMLLDAGMHFATGESWLGLLTPTRPLRVGWVENEGPQEEFRRKLERKLDAWRERLPSDGFHILKAPWGALDLRLAEHRAGVAAAVRDLDLDLLVIGPLNDLGMEGGGTPDEVGRFVGLLKDVQARAGRLVSLMVLHHENTAGRVSGAWKGRPDLLIHVTQQGNGHTRVFWEKAKWSSPLHRTTNNLLWREHEGFELAPEEAPRPERTWDDIAGFVLAHGGTSWGAVRDAVKGDDGYLQQRRDRMLEDGLLVNAGTDRSFRLWHRDDPARPLDLEPCDVHTATTRQGVPSGVEGSELSCGGVGYVVPTPHDTADTPDRFGDDSGGDDR